MNQNNFKEIKKINKIKIIKNFKIFQKIGLSDNDNTLLQKFYEDNNNNKTIDLLFYNKLFSLYETNLFYYQYDKFRHLYTDSDKNILLTNYYKIIKNNYFNIEEFFIMYNKFKSLDFKIDYTIDDKIKLFGYYIKMINDKDFNIDTFFKIYDETKKLYNIYKDHFKYFGIHGWNKQKIKNRFSYLFNNIREKIKSDESINYITTLPIIGEQILAHLKLFEKSDTFYKFDNGINIPSLLFIPFYTNKETEKHNITIQEMINIAYDNNGEYLVPLSKIYLLRKILHRGYSVKTAAEIINKYANDSKIILNKYKEKFTSKQLYQLNLNSNRTCENIHKIEGNLVLEKYDNNKLLLEELLLTDSNNKTLLLGSLSMMEIYKGNDKLLIDPWILAGSNMGYIAWNGMINKAAISCILENNKNIFSSLVILEKNPSSIYFADMYDTITRGKNNFKYMGFFLIRFKNEENIDLNFDKLCSITTDNDETKTFSNSKHKYYVMFVILDETVEYYIEKKYLLLNFKCNLIHWGNVSDSRRYLLMELQQIMCMYIHKKINIYILLKKNNDGKQIKELCNTQYDDYLKNNTKKKNSDCIEAWYHKDVYDFLLKNNISLYTNIIKKEELLKNKDKFIDEDTIKDLYTIYILTSQYSLEEINQKMDKNFTILHIDNHRALKIYDDYYLFESNFMFDNDDNLKGERLLLNIGKFTEQQYEQYTKKENICIDDNCKDIIELDNIRNTKLHTFYHDKTPEKIYDIDDYYNKDYSKYENKEQKYDLDIFRTKISKLKSLCSIIKKNKGDKTKIDIDKELSILIIDNYKINEKLEILCKNIWYLLHELYSKDRIINILKIYIKEFNIGQVIPIYENFQYIIYQGNLRERTTLICNMYYSCDVIWDILILYYKNTQAQNKKYQKIKKYISEKYLIDKIKFIESKLGLKFHEILEICKYNDKYMSQNKKICDNFTQDKYQDSSICFIVNDIKDIVKTQKSIKPYYRISSYKKLLTNKNNIYPKLSCYEIKYALQNNILIGENMLWATGQQMWNQNVNSFFYKLFLKYNKKFISGYSGSADIIIGCGLIFNSDINFLILLCIGYMCHHKDHSIHEILFASKSFNVKYDINDNEYEFVEKLLFNL